MGNPGSDTEMSQADRDRMAENAARASNFLKAISHEGRLMILCHLSAGEKSVTELEELLTYGVGMTAPFVLAALFIGPFMRWMAGFRQHLGTVEKAMGVLLIVFGLLIATNSINYIAQWMLETFPVFSAIG